MLASLLSLALCLPLVLGAPNWRIINGTEPNLFEFKSMVSIRRNGYHNCGGTLINKNTVLTAAHCFEDAHPSELQVQINAHNFNSPPPERQTVKVTKIITHPDWNPRILWHDFQILKLATNVPESKTVEYSPLPPSTSRIARAGDKCEAVGWGSTNPDGWPGSSVLQKGDMIVISVLECQRKLNVGLPQVCAKSAYETTSICKGDSGGPLFCKSSVDGQTYQVGIASFIKMPCGQPGYPAAFARITDELKWIKRNM